MTKASINKIGKIALMLLAIVMVATVFAACTSTNNQDDVQTLAAPKIVGVSEELPQDITFGQTATFTVVAEHALQDSANGTLEFEFKWEVALNLDPNDKDFTYTQLEDTVDNQDNKTTFKFDMTDNKDVIKVVHFRLTVVAKFTVNNKTVNSAPAEWTHKLTVKPIDAPTLTPELVVE